MIWRLLAGNRGKPPQCCTFLRTPLGIIAAGMLLGSFDLAIKIGGRWSGLSVAGQDLVCLAVELQQGFSFPQMLQGENVPANLLQLHLVMQGVYEQ